jgi:SH3-like domain-containing protein
MPRALRRFVTVAAALATWGVTLPASAAEEKVPPYWASISASAARMRTGPGEQYPATWLYNRAGLPVRVIKTYPDWREIRDPDGAEGWVFAKLLTSKRTAMVMGAVRELRVSPDPGATVRWRAQPGVVGTISSCAAGWCELNVDGRKGYVETGALWGVDPGETLK